MHPRGLQNNDDNNDNMKIKKKAKPNIYSDSDYSCYEHEGRDFGFWANTRGILLGAWDTKWGQLGHLLLIFLS